MSLNSNRSITIENLDDVLRTLGNATDDLSKTAQVAVRDAMADARRAITGAAPPRFKKIITSSAKRTREGQITGRAGFSNKKKLIQGHQGKDQVFDWFKAYWKNYGTLAGRVDPSVHKFDKAIRPPGSAAAQRRRNRIGQRAELFFDEAVEGWERRFLESFKKSMRKQGYPLD